MLGGMPKRILNVVTNVSHYEDPSEPTGLWLAELTHAYDVFAGAGYEQKILSPNGGVSPLEPRSLKFPSYNKSAQGVEGRRRQDGAVGQHRLAR